MLDTENMKVLYVNQAYETMTGRSCESLEEDPKSYEEVIHPEDRVRVLSRLGESVQTGQFDEEFRITKPDGTTRWVWVRGFPVRDSAGTVRRLVGTAQDISARKSAEEEIARNLDRAESAGAEADAFRKTTLALTQNLSMDYVLDTLLQSLLKWSLVNQRASSWWRTDTRLFLAREVQNCGTSRRIPKSPATLDAKDSDFLMHVLAARNSLLIRTRRLKQNGPLSRDSPIYASWLCVPLVASQQVLGLLSLGDTHAQAFTQEHLRLAKSLAIPAAVAIQNARLYEQAEIFRAELEQRLADLEQAQKRATRSTTGQGIVLDILCFAVLNGSKKGERCRKAARGEFLAIHPFGCDPLGPASLPPSSLLTRLTPINSPVAYLPSHPLDGRLGAKDTLVATPNSAGLSEILSLAGDVPTTRKVFRRFHVASRHYLALPHRPLFRAEKKGDPVAKRAGGMAQETVVASLAQPRLGQRASGKHWWSTSAERLPNSLRLSSEQSKVLVLCQTVGELQRTVTSSGFSLRNRWIKCCATARSGAVQVLMRRSREF